MTIRQTGQNSLLAEWPPIISQSNLLAIKQAVVLLENTFPDGLIDLVPAYASLTVFFEEDLLDAAQIAATLKALEHHKPTSDSKNNHWTIPVLFADESQWDLTELAAAKGLTIVEFVKIFTTQVYLVHMIGFLPGFPYLGGLPAPLHHPRKSVPRTKVPKGAVGIGGQQTGIYPSESPGGWNIIGQTPINLFHPNKELPSPFLIGDQVEFTQIDQAQFQKISLLSDQDPFYLKPDNHG